MAESGKGKSEDPEEVKPAAAETVPSPMEYFKTARAFQKKGRQKEAYSVLMQSILHYPDEPVLLSFYGCLQATVDKKFRSGIETCRKAIASFKPRDAETSRVFYPVFYLNLGRAYLAAGKRREAVSAYQKGLSYDRKSSDLRNEMNQMGIRKKAPLPFLDRSNPLNVIVGKLLHKNP
jgi:tetratricopeptide (TPR) repeat protein